jgi:ABC-type Zn uptake system ZnuABC Zn-binding protein ZnuA
MGPGLPVRRLLPIRHEAGRYAVGLFAGIALLAACASSERPDDGRVRVAVSFVVLEDIVRNIAGDEVETWSVVPGGVDTHTYEATPADLVRLSDSDGLILIGAHNERFIETGGFRRAARDANLKQLVVTEHVDLIMVDRVVDHGDHVHDLRDGDPHVWLDPRKTIEMMGAIVEFLSELKPEAGEQFAAKADRYRETLEQLDRDIAAELSVIPAERRKLVVAHNAYTYFAERYGFTVLDVVIKAAGADPSAREYARLHEVVEAHQVPAVFAEPQFDSPLLERLAEDRSIRVGVLLADSFTDGVSSYEQMLRFNARSLVEHLAPQ